LTWANTSTASAGRAIRRADTSIDRIKPGEALPPDTEVAELITMLVRFRTQAVSAVSATLAFSIESTIESAVGQILGDLIDKEADKEAPPE
jgi:type II secretory pathway component PulL